MVSVGSSVNRPSAVMQQGIGQPVTGSASSQAMVEESEVVSALIISSVDDFDCIMTLCSHDKS